MFSFIVMVLLICLTEVFPHLFFLYSNQPKWWNHIRTEHWCDSSFGSITSMATITHWWEKVEIHICFCTNYEIKIMINFWSTRLVSQSLFDPVKSSIFSFTRWTMTWGNWGWWKCRTIQSSSIRDNSDEQNSTRRNVPFHLQQALQCWAAASLLHFNTLTVHHGWCCGNDITLALLDSFFQCLSTRFLFAFELFWWGNEMCPGD